MVYEAAGHPPDGENKNRLEVRLQQLSDGVFSRSGRPYRPERDWIGNAIAEHQRQPFRAIIARNDRAGGDGVVLSSVVSDKHPLLVVAPDARVLRTAEEVGKAAASLLGCSRGSSSSTDTSIPVGDVFATCFAHFCIWRRRAADVSLRKLLR